MRYMLAAVVVMAVATLARADLERIGSIYRSGTLGPDDILLHRTMVSATAIPGQIQTQDVNYNNVDVLVTAIVATPLGAPHDCSVRLVSAGVGWTGADLQFQSNVGQGYMYQLEVWGQVRRR